MRDRDRRRASSREKAIRPAADRSSERATGFSAWLRPSLPFSGEPPRPPTLLWPDAAREAGRSWRHRLPAASGDRRRFARQACPPRSGVPPISRRVSALPNPGQARLFIHQVGCSLDALRAVTGIAIHPPCSVPDFDAMAGMVSGANFAAPQVIVGAFDDLDRRDTKVRIEKVTMIRMHERVAGWCRPARQPMRSSSAVVDCLYDSRPRAALGGRFTPLPQQRAMTRNGRHSARRFGAGGWGGIRTHGELAPSPVFKTGALNRSTGPACRSRARAELLIADSPTWSRRALPTQRRECELNISNIDLKAKQIE
jgi:hypothetical protein